MKLIKSYLSLFVVTFLVSIGLDGCYVQFGTVLDEQTTADDSPPIIYQPDPYPLPYYPSDPHPEYPHPILVLPNAGSTKRGPETNPPQLPTHRLTGVQRPSDSSQDKSRQPESTPPRTSWSPAPASPSRTPAVNPAAPARTTGPTRR